MSPREQLSLVLSCCGEGLLNKQRAGGECARGQKIISEHSKGRAWDDDSIVNLVHSSKSH